MNLVDYINTQYGTALTHIPLNKYYRFQPAGSKSKSMWVRYKGEIAFIGDYRTDDPVVVWKSETHQKLISNFNSYQRKEYLDNLRREQEEIEAKETAEKLAFLAEYWGTADVCTELKPNDYFKRKQIETRNDFKIDKQTVLIPMYAITGAVVGVQAITNDFKWFVKGSQPKDAFYPIRGEDKLADCDVVYLVEGYATGYSLHDLLCNYHDGATFQVLVCFSASNITNVIQLIKNKYPSKAIIGCADNDYPSKKAMQNIPYFCFAGADRWDANDAYCKDGIQALDDLCIHLHAIKNPPQGIEELNKFNDIVFEPEQHKYYLNGEEFTSATTSIHKFSSFDADIISEQVAKKDGVTKEEILAKWGQKANDACERGTFVHEYLEHKSQGLDVYTNEIASDLYPVADKFLADTKDKIVFERQEFRLYDIAWKVCGTVDLLVFNPKYNQYEIWDYKTNQTIYGINQYGSKMKQPFADLDDCNYNHYSMQLSLYRLMIERGTSIKIGACRLVHIAPDGYKIYSCIDYRQRLISYFDKT